MTGHHEVRWFPLEEGSSSIPQALPKGWKPLSAITVAGGIPVVVCRRWVWDEETTKEEPEA